MVLFYQFKNYHNVRFILYDSYDILYATYMKRYNMNPRKKATQKQFLNNDLQ